MKILVTGATGYIGSRLVPRLLEKGYRVRAAGRNVAKLKERFWASHPNVEIVSVNVLDYNSTLKAVESCDVAYYLVHSMMREEKDFEKADREAALNFVAAAETAGLKRLIYLGGLGRGQLSRHLQSRHEVGQIFQNSKIPVTILRAAMIIGAGSASFEILRYLVEHLPIMVTPKWVRTSVQPIAIENVLNYLTGVLEKEETRGHSYDIGGPEVTTYQELMDIYSQLVGLRKRRVMRVNVLSPWLSSHWIGLVTPLPSSLGKPLIEGLSSRVVCEEFAIRELIPQKLLTPREAMEKAVDRLHQWETPPPAEAADQADPAWAGGKIFESVHNTILKQPPERIWQAILDVGKKRGWRVLHLDQFRKLVFIVQSKLPGEVIFEFQLNTTLIMKIRFLPRGLWGRCFWYYRLWFFKQELKKIEADLHHEMRL